MWIDESAEDLSEPMTFKLKVRLDAIINGGYGRYFEVDEYISKEDYVKNLFT